MDYVAGRVGDDIMLEQLQRREDALREASEGVDVRAGNVITAAALIAVQPVAFIAMSGLPELVVAAEVVVVAGTVVAFVAALLALGQLKLPAIGVDEEWRGKVLRGLSEADQIQYGPALMTWALCDAVILRNETIARSVRRRRIWMLISRLALFVAIVASVYGTAKLAHARGIL